MRSLRPDVRAVGLVHRGHGVIGGLRIFVGGFVVEKRDLEMTLVSSLLHQGEIVIGERLALSVPVHYETGDAHVARLLDLVAEYVGVITHVAHIHVHAIPKPRHIDRQQLRPGIRRL